MGKQRGKKGKGREDGRMGREWKEKGKGREGLGKRDAPTSKTVKVLFFIAAL